MAFRLTEAQQAAVDERGGAILVSAAAGSGKTRVLVERLMGYVEQGEDIHRFLVITFTNAAAAELRERIAAAIQERLASRPEDRHLRRCATLIYQAPICTIDAFCLDFLRQWGHLAQLDPDVRLCDQAEGEQLRLEALGEVLEGRYAGMEEDAGFASLVDTLAGDRDDHRLEEVILALHSHIQAQPNPARWLEQRQGDYDLPEGWKPEDTPWGRLLLEDARQSVDYWEERLGQLREQVEEDEVLEKSYGPSLSETLEHLSALSQALGQGWNQAAACFPVPFSRLGSARGERDVVLQEQVKGARTACKKQMEKLAQQFSASAQEVMDELRAVAPGMRALLSVTGELDRAFLAKKAQRRVMDFADAEHLAVRLLADEAGNPTPLARQWGEQYVEIMVDEYQDTNAVQNTLFRALSREGRNLFFVGDVKQSIYRFRLADPTLFLDKYHRWPHREQAVEGEGRKLLLSQNFRSRPEVLEAANFVFRSIMTRMAGELDYTPEEALQVGRGDLLPDPRFQTELCCVDLSELSDEGEQGKTDKDLVEARAVAARMRALREEGLEIDGRNVDWGDMVILLRSPGPLLRHYAAALDEQGIPWSAEGGREFFGTTEVSVAIALLQILDNPVQDVPLLAVLRSPVFRFTPDRLAQLRAACPEGTVYAAVEAGGARGEADCAGFLALLEELRDLAAEEPSHRLLWQVYQRTDLPALFAALPDGEHRRANLLALYDEACRFEGDGHRGLMAFLLHLSRMAEGKVAVPVSAGEGGGVRIVSIHKSKGLEYPVVFLCGMEHAFNEEDAKAPVLFHPQLGLGAKRVDRARGVRYSTLARDAIALRLRQQTRAEEMRLLYVAMTRAEHKLFLFAAVNGAKVKLASLQEEAQCPPPPRRVAEGRSMAEWVLLPALCRPDSAPLWETAPPVWQQGDIPLGPLWKMELLPGTRYEVPPAHQSAAVQGDDGARPLPQGLEEALAWTYPHLAAADVPSKLTATQLKGRERDEEAAEDGVSLWEAPPGLHTPEEAPDHPAGTEGGTVEVQAPRVTLRRPVFEGERPLTAAQRGTALHMAMQYLDYRRAQSVEQVQAQVEQLVQRQFLTPQQGAAVRPWPIVHFFRSPLGRRLLAAPRLEREYKFSILVPAGDYYPGLGAEEEVLLQGVVDCWFQEADGTVTVIDFKTDWVNRDSLHTRAEQYRPQLEAYTRALSAAIGQPVTRRVVWFFSAGEGVTL